MHAEHDPSGLLTRLPAWRRRAPDLETLARAAPDASRRVASRLPDPFDVVSSDPIPLERLFPQIDGGALLRRLDHEDRLFSGTSPALVRRLLKDDPDLADEIEDVSIVTPWL